MGLLGYPFGQAEHGVGTGVQVELTGVVKAVDANDNDALTRGALLLHFCAAYVDFLVENGAL